jgi:hypothetical protein
MLAASKALVQESFSWWTEVAVPFGAALIGGAGALLGAWLGARWAAKEQRRFAREIAADARRERLQSDAILKLDEIVDQLEYRARSADDQWQNAPNSMASNWNATLTEFLNPFVVAWESVRGRIRDRSVLEAVERFDARDKVVKVNGAQQVRDTFQTQSAIDQARELNGQVLKDTRSLRRVLNDAL